MHAIVHPADIQDRDGGELLISTLFTLSPILRKLFADGGYQGPVFGTGAAQCLTQMQVEIVKRSDCAKGFVVLPRRWAMRAAWNLIAPFVNSGVVMEGAGRTSAGCDGANSEVCRLIGDAMLALDNLPS